MITLTVEELANNIVSVYNRSTPDEVREGKYWYSVAQQECLTIANQYSLPLHTVSGVTAALSPTNRWETNVQNSAEMCKIFVSGGDVTETRPSTYRTMRDKAWGILSDMLPHDAVASRLNGRKISAFHQCIMGEDAVCIDGHAWCIAMDDRRPMQSVPSIGKQDYKLLCDAYRIAAARVGLPKGYQMQAITWVTWRRIHNV